MLRRAEIVVTYDLEGFSDEELKSIAVSNPDSLKVDELIQAAKVTEDNETKVLIYTAASKKDAENTLIFNNMGLLNIT